MLGLTVLSKFIEEVFEKVKTHSKDVLNGVEALDKLLKALINNELKTAEEKFNELMMIEKHADDVKREVIEELHSSFLHPDDREDILRLILELDKVLGFAKSAAKRLMILRHVGISIPSEYHNLLDEIMLHTIKASQDLVAMIEHITKDPSKALEYSIVIEKHEESVDELRFKLMEKLYSDCAKNMAPLCLFLPEIVDDLEEITDRAEDVGDIYKLFIIGK